MGALAGDVLTGASDLQLPQVCGGILFSQRNIHQSMGTTGWQHDYWIEVEPDYLPAALVTDDDGAPLVVELRIRGRTVLVQVWRGPRRPGALALPSGDPQGRSGRRRRVPSTPAGCDSAAWT